ncbi:MAG: carotenoid biosynthesis protein [Bryobacteraceae bacterium]
MRIRWVVGALAGLYLLLWAGGVVAHFVWRRTPAGAEWAAPAFLACAAALVFLSQRPGRGWLAAAGAGGFLSELIGVRVPALYGSYSYTGVLQPQVAGVPVVMACAWVILIGYVKNRARRLRLKPWAEVLAGALWMTAIDLAIDPVATLAVQYWVWHQPGPYYGVPLENFLGWMLVSAALLAAGRHVPLGEGKPRGPLGDASHWVGLSVIVFFGLLALAHRLWWPFAVGVVLTGWDVWLSRLAATSSGHPAVPETQTSDVLQK